MDSDMEDVDVELYVAEALRAGASPNARDEYGDTLLLQAIQNNRPSIVKFLLKRGADVNLTDLKAGDTPLIRAVSTHDTWATEIKPLTHLVKILLAHRADPNRANRQGERPLTLAAADGQGDIVSVLLKSGANFRLRNKQGFTALGLAVDTPPGSISFMGGPFPTLTNPRDPKQVEKDMMAHTRQLQQMARAEERRLSKGRTLVRRLLRQAGAKE
jgi:hypothetical protein